MLLSYPHPIVRSRLPTPRNTQLHTQIHNRSPKSRPGRQATLTMKSAFLLNWTINCLRNSCLWVGALPGTFDLHTLPGTTSIRNTVWVHVRKNALLNHVVFLIKTNLTHSIFSTVHSNRTSSFLKSSPKILRTVCYATFYFNIFRMFLIPELIWRNKIAVIRSIFSQQKLKLYILDTTFELADYLRHCLQDFLVLSHYLHSPSSPTEDTPSKLHSMHPTTRCSRTKPTISNLAEQLCYFCSGSVTHHSKSTFAAARNAHKQNRNNRCGKTKSIVQTLT